MGLIKYEIVTSEKDSEGRIQVVNKIVSKKEYEKLKSTSPLVRKHYLFFTLLSDWWSSLNTTQHIKIIGIIISVIMVLIGFYLKHIGYI